MNRFDNPHLLLRLGVMKSVSWFNLYLYLSFTYFNTSSFNVQQDFRWFAVDLIQPLIALSFHLKSSVGGTCLSNHFITQLVFCKYILRPPTLPRTGTEDECNIIEEDGPLWETVMEGWVAHSNWFSQSHCLGFTGTFSLSTRTDRWPNI